MEKSDFKTILATDPSGGGGQTEGKKGTSGYMIYRSWNDWEIGSFEDENWQNHAQFFQNLVKNKKVDEWAIESAGNWVNVSKSKFIGNSYVMLLKAIGALHFIGHVENIPIKEILNMNVSQWESKALAGEIVGLKRIEARKLTKTYNIKGVKYKQWTFKNKYISEHEKDAVLIFYIYQCQVKKLDWPWKSWD